MESPPPVRFRRANQREEAMRTAITDLLDIEFPIFAFSHCRDVVAAVTKAGGLGVLGAVAHSPKQLEIDLRWIEEEVGDPMAWISSSRRSTPATRRADTPWTTSAASSRLSTRHSSTTSFPATRSLTYLPGTSPPPVGASGTPTEPRRRFPPPPPVLNSRSPWPIGPRSWPMPSGRP